MFRRNFEGIGTGEPNKLTPSDEMFDFLEKTLRRPLPTEMWLQVWELFAIQAINLMFPHRIIKLASSEPFLAPLPVECKLSVATSSFQALRLAFQYQESLKKIEETIEIASRLYSKWSKKCLYLSIENASVRVAVQVLNEA